MRIRLFTALAAMLLAALFGSCAIAQDVPAEMRHGPAAAPTSHVEVSQLPPAGVASFDPQKAVDAYLARISPQDKARSDAYFEGGYVLQVVDLIYALVVAGLLLWLHISSGMRNVAVRLSQSGFGRFLVYAGIFILLALLLLPIASAFGTRVKPILLSSAVALIVTLSLRLSSWTREVLAKFAGSRFVQAPIYVFQYIVVTTLVGLPLAIYEGYTREHQYGLSNQTFAEWAQDFGIASLQTLVGFVILLTLIYAVARAVQRRWWVWGTVISVAFLVVTVTIAPVYLAPMFNKYSPLPESGLKSSILSMARANGIPAENVYTFDASKQSKRISANVSGMFGTIRISLNDNLLNRCTPSEVLAVLGHEMGHYVLNHVTVLLMWFSLVALVGFWFIDKLFHGLIFVFGGNWDVRSIDDPAGLPIIMALLSLYVFLATPAINTIIRTNEIQADIFGLNAVRQPDAFAITALKLSEYRKMQPSPLEEFVFFDHPSGRTRIWEAMRWKKEHINDPDIMAGPISPQ